MKIGDLVKSGSVRGVYAYDGVQSGTRRPGIVIREWNGIETWVPRNMCFPDPDGRFVLVLTRTGKDVLATMREVFEASAKIDPKDRILFGILEAAEEEKCKTRYTGEDALYDLALTIRTRGYIHLETDYGVIAEALRACNVERLVGRALE